MADEIWENWRIVFTKEIEKNPLQYDLSISVARQILDFSFFFFKEELYCEYNSLTQKISEAYARQYSDTEFLYLKDEAVIYAIKEDS